MGIVYHPDWELSEKGRKDIDRHREKISDHIRRNIKDVISEESIITSKHGKTVKVPVRGLKDYKFIHGYNNGEGMGAGQGDSKPGDIIAKRRKEGDSRGAGNKPGEDYIETEVDIEYLINIMFEDLGLPYIEDKTTVSEIIPVGWRFDTISKKGIFPRLHKKRTIFESIKRNTLFVREVMEETGVSEEDAKRAISQAEGDIERAIDIIKNGMLRDDIDGNDVFIDDDDMRYRQIEEDVELHSNCVIFAMMDTSGSMTTDKKYLARAFLFWMVNFLRKTYNNVVIEFIVHTTEAKVVDEDTFFRKGESGGTYCYTAIELADKMLETKYPVDEWNSYFIYTSDGDDWDVDKTVDTISNVIAKNINMFGYIEILPDRAGISDKSLMGSIISKLNLSKRDESGNLYKNDEKRLLAGIVRNKNDIYPALKHILFTPAKK